MKRMTWKDFKLMAEASGVTDEMILDCTDRIDFEVEEVAVIHDENGVRFFAS